MCGLSHSGSSEGRPNHRPRCETQQPAAYHMQVPGMANVHVPSAAGHANSCLSQHPISSLTYQRCPRPLCQIVMGVRMCDSHWPLTSKVEGLRAPGPSTSACSPPASVSQQTLGPLDMLLPQPHAGFPHFYAVSCTHVSCIPLQQGPALSQGPQQPLDMVIRDICASLLPAMIPKDK